MSVWTMRIDTCIHIGTIILFRPSTVQLAPPPSAELESRNPVGLAQFFSVAPSLISTHSYLYFRPSPEVPVLIREYFFPNFHTSAVVAAAAASAVKPTAPAFTKL